MSEPRCESCAAPVDHRVPGSLLIYNAPDGRARIAYCPEHSERRPKYVRIAKPPRRGRGWDLIHAIDQLETQAQRNLRARHARGSLLPEEAQRIRAGDYSPLRRLVEPAMEAGQEIVVSKERGRTLIADQESGSPVSIAPNPVLTLTVTSKVRKARGGWSVHFAVDDRRDPTEYVRRVPPAQGRDDATEDEAHIASAYTTDARAAIEPVPIVPHEDLERFAAEARVASVLRDGDAVRERLREIEEMPARERIVALHKLASDRGVDVRDDVKAFERRVMRRLGKAA